MYIHDLRYEEVMNTQVDHLSCTTLDVDRAFFYHHRPYFGRRYRCEAALGEFVMRPSGLGSGES